MHPEIFSISLFWFVAAYTPGPNNVVASYSGFNFGIKKTIPHILGVTLGFTSLVLFLTIGLINVFKLFPIIQIIIRYLGTIFLFYLAYKISFTNSSTEDKKENPVKFFDTFIFQFLNPKGDIRTKLINITNVVYPNHTPSISGIVFFIPKLNPE